MKKIYFILLLVTCHAMGQAEQKNILLICMEDLGLQLGPYGDSTAPTPSIDALAKDALVFENAYCTQATCSPSRSSLYSGQYPHETGHMGLAGSYGYYMKPGFKTFLSVLKENGYFTGFSYKVHVNPEGEIRKDYDMAFDIPHMKKEGIDTKDPEANGRYFREFLEERPKERPFFYMAQTHDTHEPFGRGPFKQAPVENPYKTLEEGDVGPLASFGKGISMKGWLGKQVAAYYNAIQRADQFVGEIIAALKEQGLYDSTLIVFTADHGPSFARGKLSTHELGLRVPMIVRDPQSEAKGQRSEALVSLLDLAPTFLEHANLSIPDQYSGHSMKEMLKSNQTPRDWRTHWVSEYTSHTTVDYWPMRSIRGEQYKLIWNMMADRPEAEYLLLGGRVQKEGESADHTMGLQAPEGSSSHSIYTRMSQPSKYELYDLRKDSYEAVDLAQLPEYQPVLKKLKQELLKWQNETSDPFVDEEYFQKFTDAQINKQIDIREWEKLNPGKSFWGKKIARGNWASLIQN